MKLWRTHAQHCTVACSSPQFGGAQVAQQDVYRYTNLVSKPYYAIKYFYPKEHHQERFGVQFPSQGHFDVWTGQLGIKPPRDLLNLLSQSHHIKLEIIASG